LDDKGPPPDKIYEELIEKIGYFGGFSLWLVQGLLMQLFVVFTLFLLLN